MGQSLPRYSRSREGEIRIIYQADHKDKKVKNMLTLVLQAPTHWIVVDKEKDSADEARGGEVTQDERPPR